MTAPAGKDDWVKLVAIGYDEDGKEVATRPEFYLVGAEGNILEWTKWDLSALGKVVKIDFNVTGSMITDMVSANLPILLMMM